MSQLASIQTFRLIDELAANAWPAAVQQELGRWRLRATSGVTRRANSVLTAGPVPADPDWLSCVETFYARRGLPARFQISDGSPAELDALLAERGYVAEAFSSVMAAPARAVSRLAGQSVLGPLYETGTLEQSWLDAFMAVEGLSEERRATYHGIYSSIDRPTRYARIVENGRTVGVGMAVTERGWTGLFSIATATEYRNRGIATSIVGSLARWSAENNAFDLYLQVMSSNHDAIRLYNRLGFSRCYGYHYRTKELSLK